MVKRTVYEIDPKTALRLMLTEPLEAVNAFLLEQGATPLFQVCAAVSRKKWTHDWWVHCFFTAHLR